MIHGVRILCGDSWAVRLKEQLATSPTDTAGWMEKHAASLKKNIYSLSGFLRIDDKVCFLKLYRPKTPQHKLLYALGMGRPLRHFKAARDLSAQGLAVPRPLACLLVPQGALLLTEGLAGGDTFSRQWLRNPADGEARDMLRSAGELLANLHGLGYAHGNCRWSNFYWDGERAYLLDLDNTRKSDRSEQARDLARFTVNAEDLRVGPSWYTQFLESYRQDSGESRREIVERMMPFVHGFRAKYLARYGPCVQRLV